ncbi:MAG: FkbM family methyltransferase [Pyrinomonadaceae bacterium]|nr:FkbM family methyltransferase [Pyrinomonadaceae bacterium]
MNKHLVRFLIRNYPFKKGRGSLIAYAMKHVSGMNISADAFGNRFLLDLDNYIDCRMFLEGSYEQHDIMILTRCVEQYDCRYFIDVGANIGVYTVPLAAHSRVRKVYAFEPDPRNYAQLTANIFLNRRHDKVTAYHLALSAEPGLGTLHTASEPNRNESGKFNTGANSLIFNPERHTGSGVEVQTQTVDALIQLEGQNIAVKIDVEGHELSVLRGMKNCLAKNRCVIMVEAFDERFEAVNDYLHESGYKLCGDSQLSKFNYVYVTDERRHIP